MDGDVGLQDIADHEGEVDIGRGRKIVILGIGARGLASICRRFPIIPDLLTGTLKDQIEKGELVMNWADILKGAPDALGAIVAAAMGKPDNQEAEALVDTIPLHRIPAVLDEVYKATMPDGFGPFVEAWTTFLNRFQGDTAPKERLSQSPPEGELALVNGPSPPVDRHETWGAGDRSGSSQGPSIN